jgi:putative hydrolase of HD superfamily
LVSKNPHPLEVIVRDDLHPVVELFFEYAHLKQIYRTGWLKRGVPEEKCESVADHCYGVALLSYVIAQEYRPDLDISKVMMLALIHDLPESIAGDKTPGDLTPEEKIENEREACRRIFTNFPHGDKYVKLWAEYVAQDSEEAKFVHQVDKLEMALQAALYEHQGWKNLEEFFPYVKERIHDPKIKDILDNVFRIRKSK